MSAILSVSVAKYSKAVFGSGEILAAFNNLLIYFFSGTGNSYRASIWALERLRKKGKACTVPIEKARPKAEIKESGEFLLGLFFPTHGFTAPWAIIKFAFSLPRRKYSKAIVVSCRAGWKMGPFFLPGLEGTAALLIALILTIKGYKVRGFMGLDMPTNWLAVHWGLNKKNTEWFLKKGRMKIRNFMDAILAGGFYFKGVITIALGLAFLPISFGYLIMGRLLLAKVMFADYNCNSCAICAKYCPFNAILMKGRTNPKPYWTYRCESCERCIAYCPKKAIQAAHSYLFLIYYLIYGIGASIPLIAIEWVSEIMGLQFQANEILQTAAHYIFVIACAYAGYVLMYYATKIPIINRIFSFTTFTRIFRRYNEPSTTLKNLKDGFKENH